MRAEERKLLLDVSEAGASIRLRCTGSTFEAYAADRWFRRTVEREFGCGGDTYR